MICKTCGYTIPDGAAFCPNCGQKVEAPAAAPRTSSVWSVAPDLGQDSGTAPTASSMPPRRPAAPSYNPAPPAGRPTAPAYTPAPSYNPAPQAAPSAPRPTNARPAGMPKKSSKGVIGIVIGVVAIVLVAALVIGLLSGFSGPATSIYKGLEKTLNSENLTMAFEMTSAYGDTIEGEFMIAVDLEEREFTLYGTMESNGSEIIFAIYDGYAINATEYGTFAEDISDEMDDIFDAYEDGVGKDPDYEELISNMFGQDVYDEMEDTMDMDALEDCLVKVLKKLNDEKWLAENTGFTSKEKSGTTIYAFEPNVYDFFVAVAPELEDAFKDSDDFDDMMDSLEEAEDYISDVEFEFSVGLKSGAVTLLTFDMGSISLEAEFSNLGKTEIDMDELEDMLDEAK